MTEDKFLLLKLHPCSTGLTDAALREISQECELLHCATGEIVQRANEVMNCIFFVIRGSVRQSLMNLRGDVLLERQLAAGTQVGALAAASGEPTPLQIEVLEPTTFLRLDYRKALELTREHDLFRQNLLRSIAESVQSTLMRERRKKLPRLIAFFHESPATRPLTDRILKRLQALGQSPAILSDRTDCPNVEDIPHHCLIQRGELATEIEVLERVSTYPDRAPICFDLSADIDSERTPNLLQYCEQAYWCVTPERWREAVARLTTLISRRHTGRKKSILFGYCRETCRGRQMPPNSRRWDCEISKCRLPHLRSVGAGSYKTAKSGSSTKFGASGSA